MILGATLGALIAGSALHGTYYRNSLIFGRVMRGLDDPDAVALTFDDGPNPEATPRILDTLAARNVRAVFFMLGRHAERWPALVFRAHREGHQIGNHGYHHCKLHVRSPGYVHRDLKLGTEAIEAAGGGRPVLFRAPHGFRAPWVTPIARALGQRTVGWTLGVWDSDRPGVDAIVQRTLRRIGGGDILLLHDGDGYDALGDRTQTAAAVPAIVDRLRARGIRFATLPTA
ncbi:MAG: polysaccharide deacetylase family protein [Gemmatimonadaceae bacterium]